MSQQPGQVAPAGRKPINIAVDAMGGDYAPREIVKGAVLGARAYNVSILLVGNPEQIQAELGKHDLTGVQYEIIPAADVIEMDEAATAVRKKKEASINVTSRCVRDGLAQGMVAAGSTGAAMASASLYIGRIEGVTRVAIGVLMPSISKPCLLIDAGANADCTPEMMTQFAVMGNVYMHNVHQVASPRVGLLNIGEEEHKGNTLAKSTFEVLKTDSRFRFIGNVEGRDLFKGSVDVAVSDGFSGNIALKSAEGIMRMFKTLLEVEIRKSVKAKLGYLLMKDALQGAGRHADPEERGGALLLGVNGVCVISHGGSRARGIMNAIRVAVESVEADVLGKITHQLQ